MFLPADPPRGGRWADHRTAINGILFRTRAGCPWRELPGEFGNWKTVPDRHRNWSLDGIWEENLDRLRAGCDDAEGKGWTVSADSTVARARQHAAGATKIHLAADLRCRPVARLTSPGQHGDSPALVPQMEAIVARRSV